MTSSNGEINWDIPAPDNELRQSISRAVNALAEFEITRKRWGWFGWIAEVYGYRITRRLRRTIKRSNDILAFRKEVRDILSST